MLFLLGLAVACFALWWAGELLAELFTVATIVAFLIHLL